MAIAIAVGWNWRRSKFGECQNWTISSISKCINRAHGITDQRSCGLRRHHAAPKTIPRQLHRGRLRKNTADSKSKCHASRMKTHMTRVCIAKFDSHRMCRTNNSSCDHLLRANRDRRQRVHWTVIHIDAILKCATFTLTCNDVISTVAVEVRNFHIKRRICRRSNDIGHLRESTSAIVAIDALRCAKHCNHKIEIAVIVHIEKLTVVVVD